jgi:segregation and condensation protein B
MTERAEMEAALEAILFVAPEPLPRERLLELFDEPERPLAGEALDAVLERYKGGEGRGVMVEEVGGGIRLASRPELHAYLKRFFQVTGRSRLSMPALETLAIIAYRQPLTLPEVTDLRGAQSATVVKTLLERRMIRISGRKQVVGKPFLYSTTREFLLHFGLGALGDLPPLEEAEELFAMEGAGEIVPDREEEVARASAAIEEAAEERAEEREMHDDLRAEATEEAIEAETIGARDEADAALDDERAGHAVTVEDPGFDESSLDEPESDHDVEPATVFHGRDDEG